MTCSCLILYQVSYIQHNQITPNLKIYKQKWTTRYTWVTMMDFSTWVETWMRASLIWQIISNFEENHMDTQVSRSRTKQHISHSVKNNNSICDHWILSFNLSLAQKGIKLNHVILMRNLLPLMYYSSNRITISPPPRPRWFPPPIQKFSTIVRQLIT